MEWKMEGSWFVSGKGDSLAMERRLVERWIWEGVGWVGKCIWDWRRDTYAWMWTDDRLKSWFGPDGFISANFFEKLLGLCSMIDLLHDWGVRGIASEEGAVVVENGTMAWLRDWSIRDNSSLSQLRLLSNLDILVLVWVVRVSDHPDLLRCLLLWQELFILIELHSLVDTTFRLFLDLICSI